MPNGDQFVASGNLTVTHDLQHQWLINGARDLSVFWDQWFNDTGGQTGRGDSLMQTLFFGNGAGVHSIQVDFSQWAGSSDSWTGAADSDGPVVKLQALARSLSTTTVGSDAVIELSVGEFSSAGTYDPIPVVVGEARLTFDTQEQASSFDGTVTFLEAADITVEIDT